MSYEATDWAFVMPGLDAKQRAVLLQLAFRLNHETGQCNPSITTLAREVAMHADTVSRCITYLERVGLISVDREPGRSNNFIMNLALETPRSEQGGSAPAKTATPRRGSGAPPAGDRGHPPQGIGGTPRRGSALNKELNREENTEGNKVPPKPPQGGDEAARDPRPVEPPAQEPQPKVARRPQQTAQIVTALPPWLPADAWNAWVEYRGKIKRDRWTPEAQKRSLETLARLHAQGDDPAAVVDQSIVAGWTGLFPVKRGRGSGGYTTDRQRREEEAAAWQARRKDNPFADIEAQEDAAAGRGASAARKVINEFGEPV